MQNEPHHEPCPILRCARRLCLTFACATNGVGGVGPTALDPRMAAGDIFPLYKIPAGWVCLYPGWKDDTDRSGDPIPPTPTIIEGVGLGFNEFGELAPTTGALGLSPILGALQLDTLLIGGGQDPSTATDLGFMPSDAFIANKPVTGQRLPCLGDMNNDFVVDGADLAIILNDFGNGAIANGGNGNPIGDPVADVNGDGVVDGADLAVVLGTFGACP